VQRTFTERAGLVGRAVAAVDHLAARELLRDTTAVPARG
jgi:hypothetical protein